MNRPELLPETSRLASRRLRQPANPRRSPAADLKGRLEDSRLAHTGWDVQPTVAQPDFIRQAGTYDARVCPRGGLPGWRRHMVAGAVISNALAALRAGL
jgi:hypothetical protein